MSRLRAGLEAETLYADSLRERFPDLNPVVDDLYLLEPHQIAGLRERAPQKELGLVLHAHPGLVRFFTTRCPSIAPFLAEVLETEPSGDQDIAAAESGLVWEIADLIVYQRAPAMYDDMLKPGWGRDAFEEAEPLNDKVVIDAGAGTGHVAFAVAPFAATVFAVEPVSSLRAYMREKAFDLGLSNVHVMDGILQAIPLPAASADALFTQRAIGWDLPAECAEIERVVRPGGLAIHLTGMPYPAEVGAPLHDELGSMGYDQGSYRDGELLARKYSKNI